jgi:hypothetical protein
MTKAFDLEKNFRLTLQSRTVVSGGRGKRAVGGKVKIYDRRHKI